MEQVTRGIEWAAGIFEGEGCPSIAHRTTLRANQNGSDIGAIYVLLSVTSTDEDVLREFHRVMGIGWIADRPDSGRKPHHKDQWRWQTRSQAEVREGIARLYPYMCTRRRARMDEILDILAQKKERQRELARAHAVTVLNVKGKPRYRNQYGQFMSGRVV